MTSSWNTFRGRALRSHSNFRGGVATSAGSSCRRMHLLATSPITIATKYPRSSAALAMRLNAGPVGAKLVGSKIAGAAVAKRLRHKRQPRRQAGLRSIAHSRRRNSAARATMLAVAVVARRPGVNAKPGINSAVVQRQRLPAYQRQEDLRSIAHSRRSGSAVRPKPLAVSHVSSRRRPSVLCGTSSAQAHRHRLRNQLLSIASGHLSEPAVEPALHSVNRVSVRLQPSVLRGSSVAVAHLPRHRACRARGRPRSIARSRRSGSVARPRRHHASHAGSRPRPSARYGISSAQVRLRASRAREGRSLIARSRPKFSRAARPSRRVAVHAHAKPRPSVMPGSPSAEESSSALVAAAEATCVH